MMAATFVTEGLTAEQCRKIVDDLFADDPQMILSEDETSSDDDIMEISTETKLNLPNEEEEEFIKTDKEKESLESEEDKEISSEKASLLVLGDKLAGVRDEINVTQLQIDEENQTKSLIKEIEDVEQQDHQMQSMELEHDEEDDLKKLEDDLKKMEDDLKKVADDHDQTAAELKPSVPQLSGSQCGVSWLIDCTRRMFRKRTRGDSDQDCIEEPEAEVKGRKRRQHETPLQDPGKQKQITSNEKLETQVIEASDLVLDGNDHEVDDIKEHLMKGVENTSNGNGDGDDNNANKGDEEEDEDGDDDFEQETSMSRKIWKFLIT